jgi:Flp pilus assembly protein TadG
MRRLRAFLVERCGAAAVEMAFVLPAVLFLMLGGANLTLLLYASVSLNSAAQAAARYASVQTAAGATVTASGVQTFASSVYKGPGMGSLAFTYVHTGSCNKDSNGNKIGNLVTGTATYNLYYGIGRFSVPLTNQSCFP